MKSKPRQPDYDSPWKEMLTRYFPAFLAFFYPDIYAAIDWSRGFEFLESELQKIAVRAALGRRLADKLVKVWLLDGHAVWVLIHVEVQGSREKRFGQRMFIYFYRIFDRFAHRIISLAILTDENRKWRPDEYRLEFFGTGVRLKFRTVKLLDFADKWNLLVANPNPFAVVVMAHLKALETKNALGQRYRWKLELIKGLYERGYEAEDVRQLLRFIYWIMQLPEELEQKLEADLEKYEEDRKMEYLMPFERRAMERGEQKGMQEGMQKGMQQGLQQGLQRQQRSAARVAVGQLREILGELKPTTIKRIEALPVERLERLSVALLKFGKMSDLYKWLRENAQPARKTKQNGAK